MHDSREITVCSGKHSSKHQAWWVEQKTESLHLQTQVGSGKGRKDIWWCYALSNIAHSDTFLPARLYFLSPPNSTKCWSSVQISEPVGDILIQTTISSHLRKRLPTLSRVWIQTYCSILAKKIDPVLYTKFIISFPEGGAREDNKDVPQCLPIVVYRHLRSLKATRPLKVRYITLSNNFNELYSSFKEKSGECMRIDPKDIEFWWKKHKTGSG